MPTLTALHPSTELIAFAERQVRNERQKAFFEKRASNRNLLVVPVIAQPIDKQCEPIGPPLALVTRDISSEGIGLISERELDEGLIALHLPLDDPCVYLACEVRWSKPAGPFYYVGGRFVAKLDAFPQRRGDVWNSWMSRPDTFVRGDTADCQGIRDTTSLGAAKTVPFGAGGRLHST
jgi:hypothetical protein